jgi:hypothetical protein
MRPKNKCPKCEKGTMKLIEDSTKARQRALCTVCNYEDSEDLDLATAKFPAPALGSVSLWYSRLCLD